MSKKVELEQLDRTIKDGEIRLRTVKTQIESLTRDIDALAEVQDQLVENIRFLKKKQIVAMAGEYKKAREDLAKTVIRLISLKNDREYFRKAVVSLDKLMQKAQEDIEKLKNSTNVVKGVFKRKNNGEG